MSVPRHSVLIVEDELIVARDLQQTLAALGYDAFAIASTAEEAIAHSTRRCPDIVLMDIRIEGTRDGIETAQILNRRFDVPVVYLTAHADDATLERAKQTRPYGYLVKPMKSAELHSAIEIAIFKHEMERVLRTREHWFSTTLRSIADGVITVDLAGTITYVNPAAAAMLGTTVEAATGRAVHDIVRLVDDAGPFAGEFPTEAALRLNRPVEFHDARVLDLATGAQRAIADSAAPVIDAGRTLGAVMVFRDVTEQKRLRRQLEAADRLTSLGTMAAGVAHEINNPLAVIMMGTDLVISELTRRRDALVAGTPPADEAATLERCLEMLKDVHLATGRITRIVSDLRMFSRPPRQMGDAADVTRCVQWALRATRHEFQHRARVVTQLGAVPFVRGDEDRLGQVLINLLVNAAQAIEPGQADRNTVTVTTGTDERGWAVIEVRDTGTGMSPQVLARAIEPFFTTKPVGIGTGLGLSICQGIVNALGGTLAIESQVGIGSSFRVVLPPTTKPLESAPEPSSVTRQRRGRLLVIDDEEIVLRTMQRILRDHDVTCVDDARKALALIEGGERFDLILSDVMMPTMTGMELYEKLLVTDLALARRMVFLSGGSLDVTTDTFFRSVPNLRIQKPFDVAELLATIQRLLGDDSSPPSS